MRDGGSVFESRTFFDPTPIARPRHSLPLCSGIILAGAFSFPVVGVSINVHIAKATYPCLYLATSRYDPRERSSTRLIEPCFVSLHCRFSVVVQREQRLKIRRQAQGCDELQYALGIVDGSRWWNVLWRIRQSPLPCLCYRPLPNSAHICWK
jgi:hypothetical protein